MMTENDNQKFDEFCKNNEIEPCSDEQGIALAAWQAALGSRNDGAREIPLFEIEQGDTLLMTFAGILNLYQRKRLSELVNAALIEKRRFIVIDGNPSVAILSGGLSIPCIVADGAEIENASPFGPLTLEMINAGEYVLSEWLNDIAPIGQERYRQPAIEAFKAMMEAAPPVHEDEPFAWVFEFTDPDPQYDIEFQKQRPEGWPEESCFPLYRKRANEDGAAALINRILETIGDEKRWSEPHLAAFQRGTIIGMCERAGYRLPDRANQK